MSDGRVTVDFEVNRGNLDGSLKDLNNNLSNTESQGQKASMSIGKIATALGLVKLASSAIRLLGSSLEGAVSRYDTMNNFPRVMEQMGFEADDSSAAVDKLSDGLKGLPTPLNEAVASAQRIAILTGNLDTATDTTLALNNAFLASGSSSDDASRGLQQYVQMLSRGEVDLESWRTLQETMGPALNDTAKAFGFAGESAQNDLYAALKDGDITFADFNAKIIELDGGVNGFAERAKTASAGIATAFANMRTAVVRGLEGLIRSIDDALASNGLPSIQQMIEAVGTAFENVLSGMASKIPSMIAGFVSFYNAIQPFVPAIIAIGAAFLTYQTIMATVNGVTKLVSIATGILNAVLMANPIALVVAAIVGLVAAFIYLWNTNEGFKNALISTWTAIITFIQPAITAISTIIMNVWNMLVAWWGSNQALFFSTVSVVWNSIKSIFSSVLSLIVGIVQIALDRIKAFWAVWGTTIMNVVNAVWSFISNAFLTTLTNILTIVSFSLNLIKSYFQLAMDVIKNIVKVVLSVMKGDWSGAVEGIKGIVSAFKTFIIAVFNNVKTTVINLTNTMKTGAINAWNTLKSSVISAAKNIKQGAIDSWNSLKDETSRIFNKVVDSIKGILDIDLYQVGKDIINGLISGMGSMVGSAVKAVSNVASNIVSGAKNFLNIKSPSRVFRDEVGKMIPQGIAVGIEADSKDALNAVDNMVADLSMPRITAESALGMHGRMNTNPSNVSTVNNNYSYGQEDDNSQVVSLLREIAAKTGVELDGRKLTKGLSTYIDQSQGNRYKMSGWGLETNGGR